MERTIVRYLVKDLMIESGSLLRVKEHLHDIQIGLATNELQSVKNSDLLVVLGKKDGIIFMLLNDKVIPCIYTDKILSWWFDEFVA